MNKYIEILKYTIILLAGIIIFGVLISGCTIVKCYPQFDINREYIGIKCGGEF